MNLCLGICFLGHPKHEMHFVLFTDNFPSIILGNETNSDNTNDPENVPRTLFTFLTSNPVPLLQRKLGDIYSPGRWVEK